MAASRPGGEPERGESLLARLSRAMIRAQKEHFGKGPVRAKSYLLDDLLVVVMRGGLTKAEKTMLDFGDADLVRNFRQQFENRMAERLTTIVEDLTGRKVVAYQSQVTFAPDIILEFFFFDSSIQGVAMHAEVSEEHVSDGAPAATIRSELG